MSFPFTNTAPAANMPPSQSQPLMLQNFASTNSILAVDHVTFNNTAGGQHTKVTYNTVISPTAPTGDTSIGYTNVGIADPGTPQQYWKNRNATFPISAIKAFGVFAATSFAPVTLLLNSFNIASITSSGSTFTITLNNLVVANDAVAVFVSCARPNLLLSYSFASNVLIINTSTLSSLTNISFAILQI